MDPYYLTHKAESLGYHPQVILSGRRINDNMGLFVASKLVKLMANNGSPLKGTKVLVLGITFKENCPDIRNSKVIDVIRELESFGIVVEVYDPHADREEVKQEYDLELVQKIGNNYDSILLAVAHNEFRELNWESFKNAGAVIYDLKWLLDPTLTDARL